jgi:hypothetical protein
MTPGPDAGLYVVISSPRRVIDAPASRSVLALLDQTGRPRAGWPIALVGWTCAPPGDANAPWPPAQAAAGSVVVVCYSDSTPGGPWHSRAFAFDPTGRPLAVWPIGGIEGVWDHQPRVIDGQLHVIAHKVSEPDPVTGEYSGTYWMNTVAADGTVRTGRGYAVPERATVGMLQLGPDGTAYRIDQSSGATEITAFDLDGLRAGWPVRVAGLARGLAFGPNGRIYTTTSSSGGGTSRTLVFDADGRSLPFGSEELPIGESDIWSGAGTPLSPPIMAEDGTVFIVNEEPSRTTVLSVDPSGDVIAGWPYQDNVGLQWQGSCQGEAVEGCGVWRTAPTVGAGNVLYLLLAARVATTGGSILAVDPDARVRPGWPVVLPRPGAAFRSVVAGSDGTAYALAIEPETNGSSSATILAIAPDGTALYRTTVIEP